MAAKKGEKIKYRLAQAIGTCMQTTPVEAITVKQITDICGVSRQTFYRNFLDKYDLINWYFDQLLIKSFEHMGYGQRVYDSLVHKFEYIRQEQKFFAAAFKSDAQNNLKDHDFKMIFEFYKNLITSKKGSFPEKEYGDLLEMYCQASIYMTVKWVLHNTPQTPEELAELMIEAMPPKLGRLFEELDILA